MIFEKLADFIIKHAKLVVVLWVIVLLASAYPAMLSSNSLSYDTGSMGGSETESMKGMQISADHFQSMVNQENVQMLIVTYEKGDNAKYTSALAAVNYTVGKLLSDDYGKIASVIVSDSAPGEGLISAVIIYKDTYTSSQISEDTGNLRDFISDSMKGSQQDISGVETYVTGTPAISFDADKTMSRDMSLVDPISILLILILIGLFFRSFVSSAAPPMTIGVAFALVMCALFFIGQVLEIYYVVEILLLVSMLGAGCDYCIFILSRYREERRSGLEHLDAAKQAIMWAGESVFTSGLAVMIGFGSMMICDFNMVSTMGLGLAIGIVFALLAALTLMSSLVVILGDKLFWPSGTSGPKLEKGYLKKFGNLAHAYFTKSTRFSIKYAKVIIIATLLFTVPMGYVYATSETSYDMIGSMMTGESRDGMQVMSEYGDAGSTMPNYAIIETSQPLAYVKYIGGAENGIGMLEFGDSTYLTAITNANAELADKVVHINDNVAAPSYPDFLGNWMIMCYATGVAPDASLDDALNTVKAGIPDFAILAGAVSETLTPELRTQIQYALAQQGIIMTWDAYDPVVTSIMDWIIFVKAGMLGTTVSEDGNSAVCNYYKFEMTTKDQAMSDKSIKTVSEFTSVVHEYVDSSALMNSVWVTGVPAVMVEISDEMTSQFFKIEITAVILIIILLFFVMKSYLTPIRSVATILMSVIWTIAITQLIFTDYLGKGVIWMLPIMLLVICLGLGMDYDILLTTRIREYRFAKGMSNDEAITQAVIHSGSVITLCGLIMSGTFATLMLSNTVMLQQMGFALSFAILIDALVIRTYIVPAAMHIMGEWNWKGPAFLHRAIRIGRGFAGSQGILAAILMLVFTVLAFVVVGSAYGDIDMNLLLNYSRNSQVLTQLAFGLGGVFLLVFGASMAASASSRIGKLSGAVYVVSAVAFLGSAFAAEATSNTMWIVASSLAVAASVIYACFLAKGRHGTGAGLLLVSIVPVCAAIVAGALTVSFGLALAAAASVLIVGLCEALRIE